VRTTNEADDLEIAIALLQRVEQLVLRADSLLDRMAANGVRVRADDLFRVEVALDNLRNRVSFDLDYLKLRRDA
jgi:hypothetical protein